MPSFILVEDGNVIDCLSDRVMLATSILIEGDRAAAIGDGQNLRAMVPRTADLTVIDARDNWVIPGMIDVHCHMTYGESQSQEEQDIYTGVESRTLIAARNMKKVLDAGFTSISQPGGSHNVGVALRDAQRRGMISGPRMTSSGRYLTTSNSLTDFYPTQVGVPESAIGVLTNTLPEMMTQVRLQIKNGADLIKLADSADGSWQAFTNEEMKVVTDLAHQLGKKVTIHARGSAEVSAAVDAGIDWIMHANYMDDETIAKLAESGIPLVPTLCFSYNFATWGGLVDVPASRRDGAKQLLEASATTYHRAHEAGVTFVAGTDTGFSLTPYGEWHAQEAALLQEYCGLSAFEALQTITKNAAMMVGLAGSVGELSVGALADLVIMDRNPLDDLRFLNDRERISCVISNGAVVSRDLEDDRRWSNDRSRYMASRALTRDGVARFLGEGASSEPVKVEPEDKTATEMKEASEMASELLYDIQMLQTEAK